MKKLILFIAGIIVVSGLPAQAPQGITNQGVVRDSNNQVLVNAPIGKRVSILQGSVEGSAVYVEIHSLTTNASGLITYIIGDGDAVEGSFADINWSEGPYFLKTETDLDGGTNYSITGVTQFLSVPYALHSKTTESFTTKPPKAIATEATNINEFSATINGIVNAEGFSTTVEFEWGRDTDYGNAVTATESPVTGADDVAVHADLSNLQAATTYHYRIKASSAVDVTHSEDMMFTTQTSIPQLNTLDVSDIAPYTAVSGGDITYDGGLPVTQRGVVWSTEADPEIENNDGVTSDGTGSGTYTSNISGLSPETVYYVRAYATNAEGTAYGNLVNFTTEAPTVFPPELSTTEVIDITETSATSGGDISDDGGAEVTARGVVWHTSSNPSLENKLGQTNDGIGTGSYVSEITGLQPNTGYYVRAYAENSQGVSYGNQLVFVTQQDGNLPTVVTEEATEITLTTATIGGEVLNDGGSTVQSRGVCWSTEESPTLSDSCNEEGAGLGVFTSELSELYWNTTYYVRAFATSNQGTAYGNQVSFNTDAGLAEASIVSLNSGQPGLRVIDGDVSDEGAAEVTARGFVWDTAEDPTLEQNEGFYADGAGLGEFTAYLEDLTPNTKYYIRAYATNSQGTAYSEQKFFHFWDYHGTVTDVDGNVYNTVMIGNQEWMAENLRTSKYRNNTSITKILTDISWENTTEGAYTIYNNNNVFLEAYGKLYNWYAVNDSRGLCPQGWFVPSQDDWTALVNYVISGGFPNSDVTDGAGNALKSCRQVGHPDGGDCDTSEHPRWISDDTHSGFDEFGFSALPGGRRTTSGDYQILGVHGYWWSSSYYSSPPALFMTRNYGDVYSWGFDIRYGYSVRCFRNIARTEDD